MTIRAVLYPGVVVGLPDELADMPDLEVVELHKVAEVEAALAAGADVLLTYTWDEGFLQSGLRWVQGVGAGYEKYPLTTFDQLGIVFTTATGIHSWVAESAFGLILSMLRRISDAVHDSQQRQWILRDCYELAGSTIGIIGLGSIGEAFAHRAQYWEVELIGFKRHPESYNGVVPRVFGPKDLLEVCRLSDILVITMPSSPDTYHLIGAEELAALGKGWLVNVGRGDVIDEAALIETLSKGELLGAALDVFEQEPLPDDSPLWTMSNVVITPHSAGNAPRYGQRLGQIFRQNLKAYRGEDVPWLNLVVDGRRAGS